MSTAQNQKPEDKPGGEGEVKRDTKKLIGARKEKTVLPIPSSELLEKPLAEGLGALARYHQQIGEHLQSNAEKVGGIEKDVRYIEDEELPKIRTRLDGVVGAEKNDRESIGKIEGKIKEIEGNVEKLKEEIKAAKEEIAQKVDKGIEAIKGIASETATKVNEQLAKFDERLIGFDARIHEAEKSAYTAEAEVGGLKSIVIEQHQPMLQGVREDVGGLEKEIKDVRTSITPLPAKGATEEVKGIDAKPPPKVDVAQYKSIPPNGINGLRVVLEKNRAMSVELETKAEELKKEIEEAMGDLGIGKLELPEPAVAIDLSTYEGFEDINTAQRKSVQYICAKIKMLRERDALLEVLYDSVNTMLEREELVLMKTPVEPKEVILEKPVALSKENADAICMGSARRIGAELGRQEEKISMVKAGLAEIYKKYEVGG